MNSINKFTKKIGLSIAEFKKNIYLCTIIRKSNKKQHRIYTNHLWRDGRVVDCGGLENR